MNTISSIVAAAAIALSSTAGASVTGSLGTGGGSFLALSSAGLAGSSVATWVAESPSGFKGKEATVLCDA